MVGFRSIGPVLALLLVHAPALQAVEPDPYLPTDAHWVASLDVRQFANAPLVKTYFAAALRQWLADQPAFREMQHALPIDLFADVDRATSAGPLPPRPDRGVLILQGRFDLAKVQTAAEQFARQEPRAFQIHQEANRPVYHFTEASKAGMPLWVCFPDKSTMLLAPSRQQLTELLARKAGEPPALAKELRALLAGVDAKQTCWLAALASSELKKSLATSPETEKLFQSLQHLSGGASVGEGLQLNFVLQTNNAGTAGELRKFLEGAQAILSLAALDSKTNAPLLGNLVAAIKLGNVKDAVLIRAAVTKEQIEKAAAAKK